MRPIARKKEKCGAFIGGGYKFSVDINLRFLILAFIYARFTSKSLFLASTWKVCKLGTSGFNCLLNRFWWRCRSKELNGRAVVDGRLAIDCYRARLKKLIAHRTVALGAFTRTTLYSQSSHLYVVDESVAPIKSNIY